MTLRNKNSQTGYTGTDYKSVLQAAGLNDAFKTAWDAELDADREQGGLGSVSEDVIIEKAVEASPDDWVFVMSGINDGTQPRYDSITYHIVPLD